MKRFFLLTAVILGLYFSANAQQTIADTTLVIQFESLVHDYGTIAKGSDGTCEFVFTNMGQTPLIVNKAQASCGCTVPEWTREPVQPGKTGTIKVKYNTNIVNAFTKTVTVTSNAKNSPVVLTIKGTVTDQTAVTDPK